MKIYGIEKLSLVDYDDGLSTTLFTGGCNFRCPFCHNSTLVENKNVGVIDNEEIFSYLKSRVGILDAVVITGGEPTLNPDLKDFIKKIKDLGFLVKLDTNGTNPDMVIDLVNNKLVDYVAMDIKNSLEKYPLTVGLKTIDTSKITKTIDFLLENHVDYEFRTTLINEHHTEEDIRKIGKLIKGAKKYRLQKFINNENCFDNSLSAVSKENALYFKDILLETIENVDLRSY